MSESPKGDASKVDSRNNTTEPPVPSLERETTNGVFLNGNAPRTAHRGVKNG